MPQQKGKHPRNADLLNRSWDEGGAVYQVQSKVHKGLAFKKPSFGPSLPSTSFLPWSQSHRPNDSVLDDYYECIDFLDGVPASNDSNVFEFHPKQYNTRYVTRARAAVRNWREKSSSLIEGLAQSMGKSTSVGSVQIKCQCQDRELEKFPLLLLTGEGVLKGSVCKEHLLNRAVRNGAFPASPNRPLLFFQVDVLQLYHQLWHKSGLSIQAFCEGLHSFHHSGTSTSLRYSSDLYAQDIRKQFAHAYRWYRQTRISIDRAIQTSKEEGIAPDVSVELSSQSSSGQTLAMLARRCPPCFQRLMQSNCSQWEGEASEVLDLIVCLDGNFQHKRRKRADACKEDLQERLIMLPRQTVQAMETYVDSKVPSVKSKEQGCLSDYKAANEDAIKATSVAFDITGLMLLSCRHDVPLFACDIYTPGERQFYQLALLKALFDCIGNRVNKIGVLYDIACTSDKYIKSYGLVPEFAGKI